MRHLSVKFAIRTGEVLLSRGVEYRYAIKEKKKKKSSMHSVSSEERKINLPFLLGIVRQTRMSYFVRNCKITLVIVRWVPLCYK